jgi:serine protease AprX
MRALEFLGALQRGICTFPSMVNPSGVNISASVHPQLQDPAVGESPICASVDDAVDAGLAVVVAAGNYGVTGRGVSAATVMHGAAEFHEASITDPANATKALVVGAIYKRWPPTRGIWFKSSRGATGDGRLKPDLVAPGVDIWAPQHKTSSSYQQLSGTSQAAPHVSGVIAALLSQQSHLQGHPGTIYDVVCNTAKPLLGVDRYYQGCGMVHFRTTLSKAQTTRPVP